MIGYIASDGGTMVELWPVFGSDKGIPAWAQFRTERELPMWMWGEYGVSFSNGCGWRDFTMWISWDYSTYPWDFDRLVRTIKRRCKWK